MMQPGLRGLPSQGQQSSMFDFARYGALNSVAAQAAQQQHHQLARDAAGNNAVANAGGLVDDGWVWVGDTHRKNGVSNATQAQSASGSSLQHGSYSTYVGPKQTQASGASTFGFPNDDFPLLGTMGHQSPASVHRPTDQQMPSGPAKTAGMLHGLLNGTSNGNSNSGYDLSRLLQQTQPPPPPSQAPYMPPGQSSVPKGAPSTAPLLANPSGQSLKELSDEDRKTDEMLYLTTPEAERAAREKYGLSGILKVIKMTDPDLNTLALGMDLTTLGLNLNSSDSLYTTFVSPWSDLPAEKDPEFSLPTCYYMNPPQLKTAHLQKFCLETLFYIVFNMPRDMLQAYAAAELYNRGWKFHRDLKTWFVLQDGETANRQGGNKWACFDPTTWEKRYWDSTRQPIESSAFLTEDDVRVRQASGATPGATVVNGTAGASPTGAGSGDAVAILGMGPVSCGG